MLEDTALDDKIVKMRSDRKYTPGQIAQQVQQPGWEVKARLRRLCGSDDNRTKCSSLETLRALIESGMPYREISNHVGLSKPAIAWHAKKWGLQRRLPAPPLDDDILITKYSNDLWSIHKIGTTYGWGCYRIKKRLAQLGILRSSAETRDARRTRRLRETGLEYGVDANGYPLVKIPLGHVTGSSIANGKLIRLHTLEMEKHIGRPVRRGEVIHHIDFNRANHSISNLHLCASPREHALIHGSLEDVCAQLFRGGTIRFDGKKYKLGDKNDDGFETISASTNLAETSTQD